MDIYPEDLRRLYTEDLRTDSEIARLYKVSQTTVSRLRFKWGIPTLLKSDRLGLPDEITPRLKSILVGSMLGDGRLFKTGSETAAYSEHHSSKQKGYLDWKATEWGPFLTRVSPVTHRGHTGAVLTTHAAKALYPFWGVFYPMGRGHKTFGSMDPEWVDPLALAVWFMDDGSKTDSYARFSVGPDKDSQRNQLKVLKRFGLRASLHTEDNDPCIHIGDRTSFSRFVDLVAPHIVPCMSHKLSVKPRRAGPAPRDVITKDKLERLLDRGLTLQETAGVLGVSRTSVGRYVRKFGLPTRSTGRPKADSKVEYDLDTSSALISRMDPSEAEFVDKVLGVLSNTSFPSATLADSELDHDWGLLVNSPTRVEEGSIVSVSKGGSRFCQHFFQHIVEARYKNQPSVLEAWYDLEHLRKAVQFQIRVGDPVTPVRVFRALKAVVRAPTNFRPCFAKALVERFCPPGGLVLDPCAGYGGRALGTLAADRQYVGVDPHPKAGPCYEAMSRRVGVPLTFHSSPFEDVDLASLACDMVLTSPPYFSVERYSPDTSQSWVRYKTWEAWVKGFLAPMVSKCWRHTRPGAVFCVNTKNIRLGRRVLEIGDELRRLAHQEGFEFEQELELPIGRIGKNRRTEPVYVFRKP